METSKKASVMLIPVLHPAMRSVSNHIFLSWSRPSIGKWRISTQKRAQRGDAVNVGTVSESSS